MAGIWLLRIKGVPFTKCMRKALMETWLLDYLQRILTARVYDVAVESPLELAGKLSDRLGNRVWLKREDTQPVFSFKLRGAYNKMARLSPGAAGTRGDLRIGGKSRPGRRARAPDAWAAGP